MTLTVRYRISSRSHKLTVICVNLVITFTWPLYELECDTQTYKLSVIGSISSQRFRGSDGEHHKVTYDTQASQNLVKIFTDSSEFVITELRECQGTFLTKYNSTFPFPLYVNVHKSFQISIITRSGVKSSLFCCVLGALKAREVWVYNINISFCHIHFWISNLPWLTVAVLFFCLFGVNGNDSFCLIEGTRIICTESFLYFSVNGTDFHSVKIKYKSQKKSRFSLFVYATHTHSHTNRKCFR